jgi:hypothetical protein
MALSNDDVQKVRVVLSTSGWNDVMRPALENRGRRAVKALTLSRTERATAFKGTDFDTEDDVLRAIIRDCEWMITVWTNELLVAEHNRQLEELDRRNSNDTEANPR